MSTLEQFFSKSSGLPVGSIKVVPFNSTDTAPTILNDNTGVWIKTGLVYDQSTYPELYSQTGLIDAADYVPAPLFTASSISYVNNLYIATQSSNSISIPVYTSTDAITWSSASAITAATATTQNVTNIAYQNGRYVASIDPTFTTYGQIVTSTDLTTWSTAFTTRNLNIKKTIYSGERFFYIQDSVPSNIGTSTDGINWNGYTSGTTSTVNTAIFANSNYVISYGAGTVAKSSDLSSWSVYSIGTSSTILGMTYYNNLYTVVGSSGMIRTSTDLVTWTARTSGTTSTINDIVYGSVGTNSLYIAGGNGGYLRTSTDAVTWTARTSGTTSTISNVSITNQTAFYGGYAGFGISSDGVTWTYKSASIPSTQTFQDSTYANGLYLAVGNGGTIVTSTDSITWAARTSGTTSTILSIIYGRGLYVAAGAAGYLRSSTDGITWTAHNSGTTSLIYKVIYDGTNYCVLGNGGMIRTSTDLVTWTAQTSGTTSIIYTGLYVNGTYIVAGSGGMLRTSTDLVTWTAHTSGTTSSITDLYYLNNTYIYAATGIIGTSTNLSSWSVNVSNAIPSSYVPSSIGYINGKYIVYSTTSTASTIYKSTSSDLSTWTANSVSVPTNTGPTTGVQDNNKLLAIARGYVYYTFENTLDSSVYNFYIGGNTFYNSFYAQNKYYVTCSFGAALTSTDLVNWTIEPTVNLAGEYRLIYDSVNQVFVKQVGSQITTSTDFVSWNYGTTMPYAVTQKYAYTIDTGGVIFSGLYGHITSSIDLITWNSVPNIPNDPNFNGYDITYDGSTYYICVGAGGKILYSTDGKSWGRATTSFTDNLYSCCYAQDKFVAVGASGRIVTASATDLNSWNIQSSNTTIGILNVYYDGSLFKYINSTGDIGTSTDAITWEFSKKIIGSSSNFTLYNTSIDGPKYVAIAGSTVYSNPKSDTKEYSSSYNVKTSFLVPTVTTSTTFQSTSTDSNDTEVSLYTYIKAKP